MDDVTLVHYLNLFDVPHCDKLWAPHHSGPNPAPIVSKLTSRSHTLRSYPLPPAFAIN